MLLGLNEEAPGIEGAIWIEMVAKGLHDGKRIGRSAERIEGREVSGMMDEEERAARSFDLGAKCGERGMDLRRWTLEEKGSKAGGLEDKAGAEVVGIGELMNASEDFRDLRGQQ